ncbi:MAG: hypothetical protein ACREJD_09385 [Phycisphaerales bacterium]
MLTAVSLCFAAMNAPPPAAVKDPKNFGLTMWIAAGVLGFVGLLILAAGKKPSRNCGLCGAPLGKKRYQATIDGKLMTLCGNCGAGIGRKMSREALKRRGM